MSRGLGRLTLPRPSSPRPDEPSCEAPGIRALSLFGSATRGDSHADSDVRLAVSWIPRLTSACGFFRQTAPERTAGTHDLLATPVENPRLLERVNRRAALASRDYALSVRGTIEGNSEASSGPSPRQQRRRRRGPANDDPKPRSPLTTFALRGDPGGVPVRRSSRLARRVWFRRASRARTGPLPQPALRLARWPC